MEYPIRIETKRLFTRPLTIDDQYPWEEFMGNPEATRYFPTTADSAAKQAKDWMERQLGRYAVGTYGMMALIHKGTGEWIGQSGMITQEVAGATELEVGYHVFPRFWLQGYATEAARALRDFAFQNLPIQSVISIIHRDNIGSQRVAMHNGMHQEKALEYMKLPVFVFRIWREEWEKMLEA